MSIVMSMDWTDATELLGACLGKTEYEIEQACEDYGIAEKWADDAFDCDLETFGKVAVKLVALSPIVETAITSTKYHAFIKDDAMIYREEVKE